MNYPNVFIEFINNRMIWIAVFSCFSAQLMKGLIHYLTTRKWDRSKFLTAGGMPSSHSSFVVALSISIGFAEGFNSTLFALSLVFTLIVMYDAAGVRRAAGKQAKVLNMLIEKLSDQGISLDEKLKELLGHSPLQVLAGALWGIIVAAAAHEVFMS